MRHGPTAFLVISLFVVSCMQQTSVPPAGSYSNILLVTESGTLEGVAEDMVGQLQHVVDYYVKQELQFRVRIVSADQLRREPPSKNVVILGLVRQGEIGRIIESAIGTASVRTVLRGRNNVFKRLHYPDEGQLWVIVTASSAERLRQIVSENGEIIRNIIEEANRERLRDYFRIREKPDDAENLYSRYGFRVTVPYDYEVNQERGDVPGVELVNRKPHRGLAICWRGWGDELISLADSAALYDIRADIAWKMYDKDVMRRDLVFFSDTELGDYPAVLMEGYWENSEDTYGGPFMCFYLHDRFRNRLWVLDCVVYAPGFDKHTLLRELRALAETFRMD